MKLTNERVEQYAKSPFGAVAALAKELKKTRKELEQTKRELEQVINEESDGVDGVG